MAKHRAAASGGIQMLHKENRNDFRMVQLFKSHSESYLWQQTAATSTDQWSIEQKKDRKPYLYRFAICHLRCVLRKVEASRVLAFFMRDGLVSLMSPSACRQNNRSTASCANSWAELFWLHFLSFHSSCLCQKASKNFPDLGTPAPTSPSHTCCTSQRFPPAPSAEEKGRCSRGPTTMAKEREAQGTFPSRITFVINQNIAIFSWTVISIQICTLYFPLYFPDSHWLSPFVPPLNLNNDWNYHWHCCSTLAPALSLGSVTEEEWVEISVEALMVAPILFFSVISSSSLQLSWNHSLTAECLCQGCSFKDSSLGRLSSAPQCFPLTWNSYFCSAGNGDIINKST